MAYSRQRVQGDLSACIGFGLYWAWVYLSFDSGVFLQEGIESGYAVLAIHGVSCVSALAGFVLYTVIGLRLSVGTRLRCAFLGSLVASFGTLFYAAAPFSSVFSLCLVGACVSGIGAAFLVVGWGVVYASLAKGREIPLTAMAFLVSFFVYALTSRLGYFLSGWVVCALPCLSGFGLILFMRFNSLADIPDRVGSADVSSLRGAFSWRFVLGLVLTMVSYGGLRALFADTFVFGHGSWAAFVASGVVAVVILFVIGVLADSGKAGIAAGYKMALPLIALACSLILAFDAHRAPLADAFSTAASALIEMITWIVLVNVCRMPIAPSIAVFAAGRIFVHAGMFIGEGAGFVCVHMGIGPLFVVACVVMVVIATSILFVDETFRGIGVSTSRAMHGPEAVVDCGCGHGCHDVRPVQSAKEDALVFCSPVDCVSDKYELTAREKEVLVFWGAGYGSKYIEEKLCISQATVKTHVRHIYDKVGVRSRPELMLLMEELSNEAKEQAR